MRGRGRSSAGFLAPHEPDHQILVHRATLRAPSVADLLFIVAALIQAVRGAVQLTQSDGDLAAHLRMGEAILSTRHIPAHSLASYTAATEPLIAHGWLSEVLFALLFRAGGLALLVAFTVIIIGLTHGLVAVFLRRRGVDPRWALAVALISLALATSHWLSRPHMFSILGALVTLLLLESGRAHRELLFVPLFALWANLHGGWLYGLLLIAAYIAGDYSRPGRRPTKPHGLFVHARTQWLFSSRWAPQS